MMLSVLAVALPMCYTVVATDAPNPTAIAIHEEAHCWGFTHPPFTGKRTKDYQAVVPPKRYQKPYPVDRLVVRFEPMSVVETICGKGEPFGCQWY